jgi:type IV pilus assembly protein PilC
MAAATFFDWEATTRGGEKRGGTMQAETEAIVRERLTAQGMTITKIKKKAKEVNLPSMGSGVSLRDMVIFARTFSTMIDAGLPVVQCLDMLGNQADNRHFGKVLLDVKSEVEGGLSLSESLGKHPKVFNPLFRNLVAAGETGGILDQIFRRIATYLEKSDKLNRQVKSAMIYPSAITAVGVIVMWVMMTFVLPSFEEMFQTMGATSLPAPTRMVLALSHFIQTNWYFIFGAGVAAFFGIRSFKRTPAGQLFFDTVLLKLPVVGPVLRKGAVASFTRTMGTLLAAGVPILDALDIVARTSGNKVIERGILFARTKVSEGSDMAAPLMETKIFPPMVVQMISVGEATGNMDEMLGKIADFYDDEVDAAVKAMTSLIEPIILVGLGGGVGSMLIAMYLPIFEIAGAIK